MENRGALSRRRHGFRAGPTNRCLLEDWRGDEPGVPSHNFCHIRVLCRCSLDHHCLFGSPFSVIPWEFYAPLKEVTHEAAWLSQKRVLMFSASVGETGMDPGIGH